MTQTSPSHKPNNDERSEQSTAGERQFQEHSSTLSNLPKWLYDLPIRNKQITALFTSELITIVGLLAVGTSLVISSGREQLANQSKSELANTEVAYNIKINQMGFGFRGQAENATLIAAARLHAQGKALDKNLQYKAKNILRNELSFRQIEYATLVGKDLKVIVNANKNRAGEKFNPNNLVSEALKSQKQIKTSEIVSPQELIREAPPLYFQGSNRNTLIRYTVTPVKDPETGSTLGALISGDIVNNKAAIVTNALKSFQSGYNAIYQRSDEGKLTLASSINLPPGIELSKARFGLPFSDDSFLEATLAAKGKEVTKRVNIEGTTYTVAAKSINNSKDEPVAILVRGASEHQLNQLLKNSILLQLLIAGLAVGKDFILVFVLGKVIVEPIEKLKKNTQTFFQGDRRVRTPVLGNDEIGQLTSTFNEMADSIQNNEEKLLQEAEQTRFFAEIIGSRIFTYEDLEEVFQTAIDKARQILGTQRVALYMFHADGSGHVVRESLAAGFPSALVNKIEDHCILKETIEAYINGKYTIINNVANAQLSPEHLNLMKQLQIKANLIVPIRNQGKLFGLIAAHHCSQPHRWQEDEINFFRQLAIQLELLIERLSFSEQQKLAQENERKAKEQLQKRALDLLMEVDSVSKGDLTVRATVTPDEVGTIADSYNSTIENLRQLVSQVQTAAKQVETTTSDNDLFVQQLSNQASRQTEEIAEAMEKIEAMKTSINAVADSAKQAATAMEEASQTVQAGDRAMNRTVEEIMAIRETVTETSQKVKRLGDSSKNISVAVNLIGRFAAQTHLLALKASIEAARAGEQGQGFAVIADEVRALAAQSAQATAEIENLVARIQLETNEVVKAMESGTEQVTQGSKLVDETRQSLNRIAQVSQKIDVLVDGIAQASLEQFQASEVVSQTISSVAVIAEKNSNSAEQVSASFKNLLALAGELQEDVGKFKVK
jgi:twitching motility protein PilJ/methyl-accepting chemotaxis protein PixJ